MRRRAPLAAFLAVMFAAWCGHAGILTLRQATIAGGGGSHGITGKFTLSGTIGQPLAARGVVSNNFDINDGFWGSFDGGFQWPPWTGPAFPPPLGATMTLTGGTNLSRIGGITWTFTNTLLAASTPVYWGATNNGVLLSFWSPSANEIMQYQPNQSALPEGKVVWRGSTITYVGQYFTEYLLQTRCTMLVNQPLIEANAVGLPANIGGVVAVGSSNMTWSAQIYMEASFDGVNWQPALDLYDSLLASESQTAFSSFSAGFEYFDKFPVISPITNIIMAPGSTYGPVHFTLSDVEFPASSLVLTSNSDNSLILPNNAIQITGSAGSFNLSLTTAFNFLGVAHLTLTATDPLGSSGSEVITIYSDTPPTISAIGDQQVFENVALPAVNFMVGDNETAAGSLTLSAESSDPTVAPVPNITFGGSGANRTIAVQPNTGASGSTQISAIVSDGILTATNTFTLTVYPPPGITSAVVNGSGQFQLLFTNVAGSHSEVLATTNLLKALTNWDFAGYPTEISPGVFQFIDTSSPLPTNRFYIIRAP